MVKVNFETRFQLVKEIFTNISEKPKKICNITKYSKSTVTRYIKKIRSDMSKFRKSGSGRSKKKSFQFF